MTTEKISLLESAISTATDDKLKVDVINQLAFEIRNSDTQRSITLCKEAQKISSDINYSEGKAAALANEGFCYVQITNFELALEKSFEALQIFEKLKHEKGSALTHYNLCLVYQRIGNYSNGLDHITKSINISQKNNDGPEIARCMLQLGFLYAMLNDYPGAIECYDRGLALHREAGNKAGEAAILMGYGHTYLQTKEYEKSRDYLLQSMEIREQIKDWRGYAAALNDYLTLCYETEKYEEAEKIALRGATLAEELGDKMGIARFMTDLGKTYLKQNKIAEAERILLEAAHKAEQINLKMGISSTNFFLAELYKLKGDFKNALKHFQLFHNAKEELASTAAVMKAKSIQFTGRIENLQKDAEINYLKNVELKKAYREIEEKNKNITDSLNYAKRIQQAKLPKENEIHSSLPQSFVLLKPKDIVSGDFYFFYKNEKTVFIAAADCTGHGVPGALMSMVGSEKLNEAVSQNKDISKILKILNQGIKISLRQNESDESTRDGMDIALCSIDPGDRIVKYAGANRPIWIIRAGQTEVEEIKATKHAIGGYTSDDQHFDTHTIQLQRGDTFYIFSDGYADTFSGKDGKKLMTKNFKKILLEIQNKSMEEQGKHLNDFVENWKGDIGQVDDILVIGVRL
jgi:serine phosphatase RsbU (regulator of sigma subunit)